MTTVGLDESCALGQTAVVRPFLNYPRTFDAVQEAL